MPRLKSAVLIVSICVFCLVAIAVGPPFPLQAATTTAPAQVPSSATIAQLKKQSDDAKAALESTQTAALARFQQSATDKEAESAIQAAQAKIDSAGDKADAKIKAATDLLDARTRLKTLEDQAVMTDPAVVKALAHAADVSTKYNEAMRAVAATRAAAEAVAKARAAAEAATRANDPIAKAIAAHQLLIGMTLKQATDALHVNGVIMSQSEGGIEVRYMRNDLVSVPYSVTFRDGIIVEFHEGY